jgi:uncharacterized protein YfaP (DUF2135 family)
MARTTRIYTGSVTEPETKHVYYNGERPWDQGTVDALERDGYEPELIVNSNVPSPWLWAIALNKAMPTATQRRWGFQVHVWPKQ